MTVTPDDVVLTEGRLSGWVLKGSEVLNGIACRRFGVMEENTFHSFRQKEDQDPSAVYPLHPRCEVSSLEQRDILVRAKGKNTFMALVAGKYEKIDGVRCIDCFGTELEMRVVPAVPVLCGVASSESIAWRQECTTSAGIRIGDDSRSMADWISTRHRPTGADGAEFRNLIATNANAYGLTSTRRSVFQKSK